MTFIRGVDQSFNTTSFVIHFHDAVKGPVKTD